MTCHLHEPGSAYTWCPYCPSFFEEALAVMRRKLTEAHVRRPAERLEEA